MNITPLSTKELLQFDKDHIWHPYTSMADPQPCLPVKSATGSILTLMDGRQLIDGMSSWWAAIHGYNHPQLNQAITDQLNNMAHVMFGGLTHEPAVQLATQLVDITAPPLDKVFLCDSGSVAIEVAIKMSIQYWHEQGHPQKSRLLTIRNGYHGDTWGAMAVSDPDTGMHHIFKDNLSKHLFAPQPRCRFHEQWQETDIKNLQQQLHHHHKNIAAVILEPIVQGAGAMWFYHPQYLRRLRALCDKYKILLIFDEIATGFGRSGKLFAYEHADVCPDILCLGKALTGGYLTLAATLTQQKIANGISNNKLPFMHGPTFMANPLACAVASASIRCLLDSPWEKRIEHIENCLTTELAACQELAAVNDVRVLGAIGVVELKQPVNINIVQNLFTDLGVWLRPFGKFVYTMPSYTINEDELKKICHAIYKVIASLAV